MSSHLYLGNVKEQWNVQFEMPDNRPDFLEETAELDGDLGIIRIESVLEAPELEAIFQRGCRVRKEWLRTNSGEHHHLKEGLK